MSRRLKLGSDAQPEVIAGAGLFVVALLREFRQRYSLVGQFAPKLLVVLRLPGRIQQTDPGGLDLIQELFGELAVLARREVTQRHRLTAGCGVDDIAALFKQFDPQQPIVIRRLISGRDSQPDVIWIERVSHRKPEDFR